MFGILPSECLRTPCQTVSSRHPRRRASGRPAAAPVQCLARSPLRCAAATERTRAMEGSAMKPYILDDASAFEYKRLDLMSKILDPWTRGYLTGLGITEGWRCLELGGGNGSITEWLSATVGPSGTVTALDINPVLLELIPAQNLSVRRMDVRTGE